MRRLVLVLLPIVLGLAACEPRESAQQTAEAGAPTKGVDRSHKGKAAPDTGFKDPDGGDISLADFRGTPVLVNLWATWCAPCVKELPTLNALSRRNAVDGAIGLIAISQDMGPQNSVRAFLETLAVDDLGAYHDPEMALSAGLGAEVLPTTILFDRQGREVWRYVGELDWTGEEAARLLAESGVGEGR